MWNRWSILLLAALCAAAPVHARELEESPAPFSLTPLRPGTPGVPLASSVTVPAIGGVPVTNATIGAAAAIAAPAGGITGVAQIATPGGAVLAPMGPPLAGVPVVTGAPLIATAPAAQALGSPLASFNGFYYPSHSVLVSNSTDLLANTDGRVFMHPGFPGHMMYYNSNEGRWCFQDDRSMSGWFFVPREIFIAPPR